MGTDIRCNQCNAHLGHVQCGEGFRNPAPNERHCVNSCSISFQSSDPNVALKRCTYDGPVYMYAARQKGEAKSSLKDLEGGCRQPCGQEGIWASVGTNIKILPCLKAGATFNDLHKS